MHKFLKLTLCLSAFLGVYGQAAELKIISAPLASRYAQSLSDEQTVSIVHEDEQFKDFCRGIGKDEVDILLSDRKITSEDIQNCQQNGIAKIIEIPLAYNAILLQTSSEDVNFSLSSLDLYKAFAAYKWDDDRGIIANDTQKWLDVDARLNDAPINIVQNVWPQEELETLFNQYVFQLCMSPSSEKLEENFKNYSHWKETTQFFAFSDFLFLDQAFERYKTGKTFAQENFCKHFRADNYRIMNDEQFGRAKVSAYPKENQIFISTYALKDNDFFILRIENQIPSADSIEQGLYPLSYGVYAYVKLAHVGAKKGLKEYIDSRLLPSVDDILMTAKNNKYILPRKNNIEKALQAYQNYQHYIQALGEP